MSISSNRLFPYPVLNAEKLYSGYKDGCFELIYNENMTDDEYVLQNIYCNLNSNFLKNLIESGKAKMLCIVECPITMFRESYELSVKPQNICIPLFNLNGKTSVSAFIVATQNIEECNTDEFAEDYSGYAFYIEKNDILAFDTGYTSKVDYEVHDDKISSIFQIIKDTNIKDSTMIYNYTPENIVIKLPEKEWGIYDKTKDIESLRNFYFSIVGVPALAESILRLQIESSDLDILTTDYSWFNSFVKKYNELNATELTNDDFYKMNVSVECQKILGLPNVSAISDIYDLLFKNALGGSSDDND